MPKPRTVRLAEIAELRGGRAKRTRMIVQEEGFPQPIGQDGRGLLWDRREVEAWTKEWPRLTRSEMEHLRRHNFAGAAGFWGWMNAEKLQQERRRLGHEFRASRSRPTTHTSATFTSSTRTLSRRSHAASWRRTAHVSNGSPPRTGHDRSGRNPRSGRTPT